MVDRIDHGHDNGTPPPSARLWERMKYLAGQPGFLDGIDVEKDLAPHVRFQLAAFLARGEDVPDDKAAHALTFCIEKARGNLEHVPDDFLAETQAMVNDKDADAGDAGEELSA